MTEIGIQFGKRPFLSLVVIGAIMLGMAYTSIGKGGKDEGPYAEERTEPE